MKRGLTWSLVLIGGLVAGLLAYGALIEPRLILDVEREEVVLPDLGGEWSGTEVAIVSDWQVGMWFATIDMMERVTDRILEEAPDLVLLGGDFIYVGGPPQPKVDEIMEILGPVIDSDIPTCAVLGNHDDDADGAEEMTRALEDPGVPVLMTRTPRWQRFPTRAPASC